MIDKKLFLRELRIRKGVLYVKEIVSKPVVSGWDLIPSRGHGSANNLKKFVEAMSISVIGRSRGEQIL